MLRKCLNFVQDLSLDMLISFMLIEKTCNDINAQKYNQKYINHNKYTIHLIRKYSSCVNPIYKVCVLTLSIFHDIPSTQIFSLKSRLSKENTVASEITKCQRGMPTRYKYQKQEVYLRKIS